MAVLAKNRVWLGAFLTEVDFNHIISACCFFASIFVSCFAFWCVTCYITLATKREDIRSMAYFQATQYFPIACMVAT